MREHNRTDDLYIYLKASFLTRYTHISVWTLITILPEFDKWQCIYAKLTTPIYPYNFNIALNVCSSSPDSLTADRSDKSSAGSTSPVALYKLVVPLLRCEVPDVRDAAVNALGMINHDALK